MAFNVTGDMMWDVGQFTCSYYLDITVAANGVVYVAMTCGYEQFANAYGQVVALNSTDGSQLWVMQSAVNTTYTYLVIGAAKTMIIGSNNTVQCYG